MTGLAENEGALRRLRDWWSGSEVAQAAGRGDEIDAEREKEILDHVRHIEIRSARLADESFAGQYHSAFKGRGIDFEEVREYIAGDDIRSIDWNVTARAGRPFIKKFREERELTVLLLVDLSASGDFGSADRSKRELAAEIASVLAFSAIRNDDKVGLILFTDEVESYLPPKKGRRHVLRVIREILYFKNQHRGTDLRGALEFATHVRKRRALTFLISDLLGGGGLLPDAATRHALDLTARRHDLVALQITDPRERELPAVGRILLEDAETGEIVEVDTGNRRVREDFAAASTSRRAELARMLRNAAIDHLEIDTQGDWLIPLRRFFKTRASRNR
ncbi:MAG: DUF58 domain-containing protein [Deltaproteobacteria bacterium]